MKLPAMTRTRALVAGAAAVVAAGGALIARRRAPLDLSIGQLARRVPVWGRTEVLPPPEPERQPPYMGPGPTQ